MFTYKYVVNNGSEVIAEEGAERELHPIAAEKAHPALIIVDDGYFKVKCSSFLKNLEHYLHQAKRESKMS